MLKKSFLFLTLLSACSTASQNTISQAQHEQEIADWQQERMESLVAEDGWLNLIGLFWLQEGTNTFGSGSGESLKINSAVAPETLGVFELQGTQVFFTPMATGLAVAGSELTEKIRIFDAEQGESLVMSFASLRWNIIKRGDAYGVRLRDLEAPAVRDFTGISHFPVSAEWRIKAKFVAQNPPRELMITNVLGQTTPNPSPGFVVFEKNGQEFKIQALGEGDQLFLILADQTSSAETYGGGRYLYVTIPQEGDEVILDFNKAYNPPCVFTPFATCPLPPKENVMDLRITAGEKTFGEH